MAKKASVALLLSLQEKRWQCLAERRLLCGACLVQNVEEQPHALRRASRERSSRLVVRRKSTVRTHDLSDVRCRRRPPAAGGRNGDGVDQRGREGQVAAVGLGEREGRRVDGGVVERAEAVQGREAALVLDVDGGARAKQRLRNTNRRKECEAATGAYTAKQVGHMHRAQSTVTRETPKGDESKNRTAYSFGGDALCPRLPLFAAQCAFPGCVQRTLTSGKRSCAMAMWSAVRPSLSRASSSTLPSLALTSPSKNASSGGEASARCSGELPSPSNTLSFAPALTSVGRTPTCREGGTITHSSMSMNTQ
eukprot:6195461-Pleurochrysis_carterae.AAC.8